jgi:hypothetical protein
MLLLRNSPYKPGLPPYVPTRYVMLSDQEEQLDWGKTSNRKKKMRRKSSENMNSKKPAQA